MAEEKPGGKIREVAAVIMAGGRGRRMGRDKCLIELGGKALVRRAAETAAKVFERVIISGPSSLNATGLIAAPDERQGAGPLAGILAGLKATGAPWIMTIPCDSPFVPEAFLIGMVSLRGEYDVVVPRQGEFHEPLHALYSCRCIPGIEGLIAQGEKRIIALYGLVKTREVGPETYGNWDPQGLAFFNINTPADLSRAEDYLASQYNNE
jgi:molybdopterin-guanine dinucleotide biosynthesis protein A